MRWALNQLANLFHVRTVAVLCALVVVFPSSVLSANLGPIAADAGKIPEGTDDTDDGDAAVPQRIASVAAARSAGSMPAAAVHRSRSSPPGAALLPPAAPRGRGAGIGLRC